MLGFDTSSDCDMIGGLGPTRGVEHSRPGLVGDPSDLVDAAEGGVVAQELAGMVDRGDRGDGVTGFVDASDQVDGLFEIELAVARNEDVHAP